MFKVRNKEIAEAIINFGIFCVIILLLYFNKVKIIIIAPENQQFDTSRNIKRLY